MQRKDGFERFNIRNLSPTMVAQWDQAPATLILKRVFGLRTKPNANMWRGDAVESGLQFFLYNRDKQDNVLNAKQHALDTFWHRADGVVDEETEAAAELVPDMVEQAVLAVSDFPSPIMATQLRVDQYFDGLPVPFIGNMDFVFEDGSIIELKTTTRCPSSVENVSLVHKWQAGTYAKAREKTVNLLYVTAKKFATYPIEPEEPTLALMQRSAAAMNNALYAAEDGSALLNALPLNADSFYWDDDAFEAYERAMNGDLRPLVGPGTENLAAQGYVTFGKYSGKHISDLPTGYLDWLLEPKLSNGETFDVPIELQDAIREMREAA